MRESQRLREKQLWEQIIEQAKKSPLYAGLAEDPDTTFLNRVQEKNKQRSIVEQNSVDFPKYNGSVSVLSGAPTSDALRRKSMLPTKRG